MPSTAVVIGRFQPFHNGHLHLLTQAACRAEQVVVVLGSAQSASTAKNPFNAEQRQQMILAGLPCDIASKVVFVEVPDLYDEAKWVTTVVQRVEALSNGRIPVLVGHEKDDSSYYLKAFPFWGYERVEAIQSLDATTIRKALFEEGVVGLEGLRDTMPAGVLEFLKGFVGTDEYERLRDEHAYVTRYKSDWAKAPYPATFVTVDSVIQYKDKVLLVTRKGQPGRGLLALPGGFLDQHEEPLAAALRETAEETGVGSSIAQYLCARRTFSNPYRSQLGRVITFGFYFDLSEADIAPEAVAGDDAAQVHWMPLNELELNRSRFHDDHYQIITTFLNKDSDSGLS